MFSILWVNLSRRGKNPSIAMKFGLGIVQLGLGYLVLLAGAALAGPDALVPLFVLGMMYLLHTTGELFLSPIGLSMVTKLAPKHMTGAAMGAWFLSFAFSMYVAAVLAKLTGAEGDGVNLVELTPVESLDQYVGVFGNMGWVTVGIGIVLVPAVQAPEQDDARGGIGRRRKKVGPAIPLEVWSAGPRSAGGFPSGATACFICTRIPCHPDPGGGTCPRTVRRSSRPKVIPGG